jgi:HK97 family phage major capsid protein/HK97 family phage prohead protease
MNNINRKNVTIDRSLLNEEEGVISGYASVFEVVDQHNDLINHGAFNKIVPEKVKLLWQHKQEEPIGIVEEIYEDDYGLYFRAKLLLDLPQAKSAYNLVKSKAISGVSIGFKPLKYHYKQDIRIIENIDLWEISLVTFPANVDANILEVKGKYGSPASFHSQGMTEGCTSLRMTDSGGSQEMMGGDNSLINLKNHPPNFKEKQSFYRNTENQFKNQNHKLGANMQINNQQAWEDFKSVNEEILKSTEQKGSADPLLSQQLLRINDHLDSYKSRLDNIETSMSRPFNGGELFIPSTDHEHKSAFNSYLRSGNEQDLNRLEQKSLSSGSDADGGYLLSRQTSNDVIRSLEDLSPMRQLASSEIISSGSLDIIEDYDQAQSGWTTETSMREETDTPKISKRNIPVFELYAQPAATQKLIDDSSIDIENWLSEKLVNSFDKLESDAFFNGDGSSCPRGILTYGEEKIEQILSNTDNMFEYESLLELYFSLKEKYCRNASFLMNRSTMHMARTIKDKNTGKYIWNPAIEIAAPDSLFGVPVYESTNMPIVARNSLSVALGDFKAGYKIVDRAGIRILRDPYTYKPFVKFYATKRVGGDVTNFDAIKLLKIA